MNWTAAARMKAYLSVMPPLVGSIKDFRRRVQINAYFTQEGKNIGRFNIMQSTSLRI